MENFNLHDPIKFEDMYDVTLIDKQLTLSEEDDPDYIEFDEKDYNEFYAEQVKIANIEYATFKQDTSTSFDGIVNKYKTLVGLTGASYEPTTKIIFYSLLANQLKLNKFSFESKQIDLRLSVLLQLKAGHGKKNYEYFIKRTIEGLGRVYQEPTSYHPEQFIGKIIAREVKNDEPEYTAIFGTLAADFLVIDEAHAMLTRKDNEECLRYIRTALDPIGDNTIMKKQVNIPDEHKLKYNPTCTMLLLTQPITNISEDLLMRGSFRRFVILFVNTTLDERLAARRSARFLTLKEDIYNKIWIKWIEFNKILSEYKNLQYICENYSYIDDYLDKLVINAKAKSAAVLEFYNSSQYTIKQSLFKMAIIRAIVEHKPELGNTITISCNHIESAIEDWDMIWGPQINWISQQMHITSLNPLKWNEETHGVVLNLIAKMPESKCETSTIVDAYCRTLMVGTAATRKAKTYKLLKELLSWGMIIKTEMPSSKRFMVQLVCNNI